MYYAIGVSVPSIHRESTDSLIVCSAVKLLLHFRLAVTKQTMLQISRTCTVYNTHVCIYIHNMYI